jgi:membrane protein implicated in regulation of membrane protease activity
MWIVAIAWMYVAVMMALAEATASNGTVLGAMITLLLYGIAPLSLVMYLLGTPARRKARRAAEALELAQWQAQQEAAQAEGAPDPSAQPTPEEPGLSEPRSGPPAAP